VTFACFLTTCRVDGPGFEGWTIVDEGQGPSCSVSPRGIDLGNGQYGYQKTKDGGPTEIAVTCMAVVPIRQCPNNIPPSVDGVLCRIVGSATAVGDPCPGTLCTEGTTLVIDIECLDDVEAPGGVCGYGDYAYDDSPWNECGCD
jgi:hypothetical protein